MLQFLRHTTKALIIFLALIYYIVTGEIVMGAFFIGYFLLGSLFLSLFYRRKKSTVYFIYELFYMVYGTLTLLTQIVLIKNPDINFYIHIDASHSFYYNINEFILPCSWSELPNKTLFNVYFTNYPIASFIMGAASKLGLDCGIENLRLYQRVHIFLMAALTPAIMASALEIRGVSQQIIRKSCVVFGVFSYLWIGSCIFTRDMHVTFIYVLFMYVFLHPNMKFKFVWFVLLAVLATGMRPLNGAISVLYIIAYYYSNKKRSVSTQYLFLLLIGVSIYVMFETSLFEYATEKMSHFDEDARESTGLFSRVYNLPFPLDKIAISIYMLMQPLPIQYYMIGAGKTFMTLPFVLSPYIMATVLATTLYHTFKHFHLSDRYVMFIIISIIVFFAINSGSPDLRRSFAAIPGLFVAYVLVKDKVPLSFRKGIRTYVYSAIFAASILLTIYTLM